MAIVSGSLAEAMQGSSFVIVGTASSSGSCLDEVSGSTSRTAVGPLPMRSAISIACARSTAEAHEESDAVDVQASRVVVRYATVALVSPVVA